MLKLDLNRREFLKISAGAGAALAMPISGHAAVSSRMIGIQVGAVSFADEGTEKVLDVLQERADVNTLFLAVFTTVAASPEDGFRASHCPTVASRSTISIFTTEISPLLILSTTKILFSKTHARPTGDLDILAEALPAAKKRGMKVICWLEDVFRTDLPNIGEAAGARSVRAERRHVYTRRRTSPSALPCRVDGTKTAQNKWGVREGIYLQQDRTGGEGGIRIRLTM